MREQKVLYYYYWHRLTGTALAWFFWDVSFYGNKLFQSTFIEILSPGASILLVLEWTLLNSFVSLVSTCASRYFTAIPYAMLQFCTVIWVGVSSPSQCPRAAPCGVLLWRSCSSNLKHPCD